MAYAMNTLYIEWILEQIFKTAKPTKTNFIFCLDHISLYNESAAWLPDPCLDRDESTGKH